MESMDKGQRSKDEAKCWTGKVMVISDYGSAGDWWFWSLEILDCECGSGKVDGM